MYRVTNKVIRLRLEDGKERPGLDQHPIVLAGGATPVRAEFEEQFFDTPSLDLYRRGIELWVQHEGEKWVLHLTGSKGGKGLSVKVPGPELNLDKLKKKGKALAKALAKSKVKPNALQSLFSLRFTRTTWKIVFPGGTRMVFVEEQGEREVKGRIEPFDDLILEWRSGNPVRLYQSALALAYCYRPALGCISPVEKGFGDYAADLVVADDLHNEKPVRLSKGMTAETAFAMINGRFLRRIQGRQRVATIGSSKLRSRSILDIYEALGWLRAMVAVYDSLLPSDVRDEVDEELRWLRGELEQAVAWEIFFEGTLVTFVGHFSNYSATEGLHEAGQAARDSASLRVNEALSDFRFTRLILGLAKWLGGQGWRELMDRPQKRRMAASVAAWAKEVLDRHHNQVRRSGKDFEKMSLEQRHKLGEEGALLLDVVHFFGNLFPAGKQNQYRKALERLQEALNSLNEVERGHRLFAEIAPSREDPSIHLFKGWLGAEEEGFRQSSDSAWKAFAERPVFWHQGRK